MLNKLFNLLSGSKERGVSSLTDFSLMAVDLHSHLIPGIDDGVKTLDESLAMLRQFAAWGFKKVITTPHLMAGGFNNTPEIIINGKQQVQEAVKQQNICRCSVLSPTTPARMYYLGSMNFEHHPQFFTATILEWKSLLASNAYKSIIADSLRFLVKEKRVRIFSFVIMPNHVHIIWQINDGYTVQQVQQSFLKFTAQQMKFDLQKNNPKLLEEFRVDAKDRQYQFWERNALSIDLFTEKVFDQKFEYVHNNPIQEKWRLAEYPEDYKWSSARFYLSGVDEFGFLTHVMGNE